MSYFCYPGLHSALAKLELLTMEGRSVVELINDHSPGSYDDDNRSHHTTATASILTTTSTSTCVSTGDEAPAVPEVLEIAELFKYVDQ